MFIKKLIDEDIQESKEALKIDSAVSYFGLSKLLQLIIKEYATPAELISIIKRLVENDPCERGRINTVHELDW